jgi:hypothetical protein
MVQRSKIGKKVFPAKTSTFTTTSTSGGTPLKDGSSPIPALVNAMMVVKTAKEPGFAAWNPLPADTLSSP